MRRPLGTIMLITALSVAVAGCSQRGLRDLRPSGPGPDEFMILPVKPLTAPADYATLPPPTPGAGNLVDPNPIAEGIVAMGGSASALEPGGIPASEAALVTASSRHGVDPSVRETLAEQDATFRKRMLRMSRFRVLPVDRYEQAYRRQALDPFRQTERFRSAGAGTPTSPPEKP